MRVALAAVASALAVAAGACGTSGAAESGGGDDASIGSDGEGMPADGGGGDSNGGGDGGVNDARPLGPARVYVGSSDGKIRVYSFDASTKALAPVDTTTAGSNPSFLAMDPTHRSLYAVDESSSMVLAFAVDGTSGKLTALNSVSSGGNGPAHVSVDASGKFVMAANYGGGTIAIYPRMADGRLGTTATATRSFGGTAQTHEIVTDPTNAFVLVPNKGLDSVAAFRLDPTAGTLTDLTPAAAGDGARHIVFDAAAKHAYVIDENSSMVTALTFDKTTGAFGAQPFQTTSSLPDGYAGPANTGAEIAMTPDGRHVIASNRGDDSLMVFDVAAQTGMLTKTQRVSSGGKTPRHFSIEQTGAFLFVGNQGSNSVVIMQIDPATGVPSPVGSPLTVPSPEFVGLFYL